jgi:SAM-dependent methyltransferase
MAMVAKLIKFFLSKQESFNYHGRLLTLGKQEVFINPDQFKTTFNKELDPRYSHVTDEALFKALGFEEVQSLDYFGTPDATIEHDLNTPIDQTYWGKYDFIVDAGTLEHCFNAAEYMSTITRLLKVGGTVIHSNPTQGDANHGFYNFQPTFYFSFYGANGFSEMECYLVESLDEDAYTYPGSSRIFKIKNLNNLKYFPQRLSTAIIFKAVKKVAISKTIIPIQEFYYRIMKEKQLRNVSRLPDEVYREILGDSEENTYECLLKNSYLL